MNASNVQFERDHPDPLRDSLPPLVLDRQRIVHSASFRRLEYKTQVFVALEGDHFRTRLTHTLEVADLARILATQLGDSAELAEVVALAHDLGHAPFGHAGERALDDCVRDHGGFEHNAHSLRVVEYLEHPYPDFRGLNLTRCVRECLAKHSTKFDHPGAHPLQDGLPPPREGQIAALADRLAYSLHDLQDGLHAGLIEPADLASLEIWSNAYRGPRLGEGQNWRGHLRPTMDRMQCDLLRDVCAASGADAVRLSAPAERRLAELETLLLTRMYRDNRLVRMDSKARRIIKAIYDAYQNEPQLMPRRYFERVASQGAPRIAADYIAGMTDRFCLQEHARLFDPSITP